MIFIQIRKLKNRKSEINHLFLCIIRGIIVSIKKGNFHHVILMMINVSYKNISNLISYRSYIVLTQIKSQISFYYHIRMKNFFNACGDNLFDIVKNK